MKEKITHTLEKLKAYSLIEQIQLLFASIFIATLTCSQGLNSIALGIFLTSLLFTFKIESLKTYKKGLFIFMICSFISVLSISYSSNPKEGWRVTERQLALFLIPIIFFGGFKLDTFKFKLLIKFFHLSIVIVCVYLINISIGKLYQTETIALYHDFSAPVNMHATFLSLYVALAIFAGLYWHLSPTSWWISLCLFLTHFILIIALALLSSRIVVFSTLLILFFIYPFYTQALKYKFLLAFSVIMVLSVFIFLAKENSFISNRFFEKIEDEIKLSSFLHADTTYNPMSGGETRADRWYCAVELIKEKPLFGYGTGSEKDVLMKKYEKYNLQNAIVNNYDAHNQYLAYGIKTGIFVMIFFTLSLLYSIYISIKNKNFLYLSFILLFAITCFTENVLESNKGIFFYAFFNSLLCAYCLQRKNIFEN